MIPANDDTSAAARCALLFPHWATPAGCRIRLAVGNVTKIGEISGRDLDMDLDLDLDVDLDSREQTAGSRTGQPRLLASKRMV